MNSGFAYDWELRGAARSNTGRKDFAGGSAVLPTLSKGLDIELSEFEAENATLKGDYMWQVVEIVIGGVPIILEVGFMCMFMSRQNTVARLRIDKSVRPNETSSGSSES